MNHSLNRIKHAKMVCLLTNISKRYLKINENLVTNCKDQNKRTVNHNNNNNMALFIPRIIGVVLRRKEKSKQLKGSHILSSLVEPFYVMCIMD